MSDEAKLPRGAVKAAAEALREVGVHPGDNGEVARMALTAAVPLITRSVQRDMAKRLLEQIAAANDIYDAYYDTKRTLRQAARSGQLLPTPSATPEG